MKKLLFLAVLSLFSCSTDDDTPIVQEMQYSITIRDTCREEANTKTTKYCLTETEYKKAMERINSFPSGVSIGCEWDVTFTDKTGTQRTGWHKSSISGNGVCN